MITFTNERLNSLLQKVIAHENLKLAIYGEDSLVIENILDGQMFSFTPSDADNELVEIVLGSIDAILRRGHAGPYPKIVDTAEGKANVEFHHGQFCLSEHVEGNMPYCPMYGGFGKTIGEAIASFERAVRGEDEPKFTVKVSKLGSNKLAVVACVKQLFSLSGKDALARVNDGIVIQSTDDYTRIKSALEETGATVNLIQVT